MRFAGWHGFVVVIGPPHRCASSVAV